MLNRDFGFRREVKRLSCDLKGTYVSGGISHEVQSKDISNKGLGVITATPLQIDSQVKLEMSTKNKVPLLLAGRVCWCRKLDEDWWRSGVIFNRPLPFELKKIV